jgi:hypothetical protein
MESRNRNVWIVVAVIAVVLCFCVVMAGVIGVLAARGVSTAVRDLPVVGLDTYSESERIEKSFVAGEAPSLRIDNFAGEITVRAGESDTIEVVATKKARRTSDLGRIEIEMYEQGSGAVVKTRKPGSLNNVAVRLEVTVPASTRLDLRTGAGTTDVRGLASDIKVFTGAGSVVLNDVVGDIEAHTGAGSIEVRQASGRVQMDTGAGAIQFQGELQGNCRFTSGAGEIRLELPADLNMEIDLSSGLGSVNVGYPVVGQTSRRSAKGYIGTGSEGSIYGFTGVGGIELNRR